MTRGAVIYGDSDTFISKGDMHMAGIKLGYCDEHSLLEIACEARNGAVGGIHPSRQYFSIRSSGVPT